MRWWAWVLIGLVVGGASVWVWGSQQQAAAQRAYDARLRHFDSASVLAIERTNAALALRDTALFRLALVRAAHDSTLAAARRANAAGFQLRAKLASVTTAADSVPLLLDALTLADREGERYRAADSLATLRADSLAGVTSTLADALSEQRAETAKWRTLASERPVTSQPGRMPVLNIPWPKVGVGPAVVVNKDGAHFGLGLAVVIPL